MKVKNISYNSTHIPDFKKHIVWLGLFAIGVIIIAFFQATILIKANNNGVELTTLEMVAGFGCLIVSLVYVLFMVAEISRHFVLIKKINDNGFVERRTFVFDYSSKFSFGNLFRLFEYIVLTATVIFVIGFTTYCVLNYVYYTTINYYLPIILMVFVTTFYATKLIELKYEVEK